MARPQQNNEQALTRARKPKNTTPHAGRRMLYLLLALAVASLVFLAFLFPYVAGGTSRTAVIKIPANATEKNVHDSLAKYFDDAYASRVLRIAGIHPVDFSKRHGAYEIPEGTSPLKAFRRLAKGAQTPVRITINGFRSLPLLLERVSRKFDFSADSLANAISAADLTGTYGLTPDAAMALLIDDSYDFYWSASPEEFITKAGKNYLRLWNDSNRRKAQELGVSPQDVMIIASIVDEETNDASEKGKVGRLYINRLHKGMKLQADPTVRFAANDFTIKRVAGAVLRTESPYNTYLYQGLPPGPIRTTSAATVEAILNEPANDYIYMCAKEDFSGSHNFTSSYEEHLANARRYRAALDARGITAPVSE